MSNREHRDQQRRETKRRIPPGQPRLKLSVDGLEKGYRGYWATKEQFQELQDAGYTFVKKQGVKVGTDRSEGENMGSVVSRGQGDSALYLMQIPEEWYQENQAHKQREVRMQEDAILQRKPVDDEKHFYTPDENRGSPNRISDE